MSSRLLSPDDPRPIAPVLWPSVAAAADRAETPVAAAPEPRIDLALLEHEWQNRVAEARAAGFREGEGAARSRAAAEVEPVLERLARAIEDIAGLRPRLRREAEADTVKLALAIARRVIRRELAVDPEALHGLVLAALEKLQTQEVHRSQAPAIAELLKARGGLAIEIVPDVAGDPGTVVFKTARGNLDASVESQLDEIERGLADLLRRQK
jgi:flagellar assembly protein FliH